MPLHSHKVSPPSLIPIGAPAFFLASPSVCQSEGPKEKVEQAIDLSCRPEGPDYRLKRFLISENRVMMPVRVKAGSFSLRVQLAVKLGTICRPVDEPESLVR